MFCSNLSDKNSHNTLRTRVINEGLEPSRQISVLERKPFGNQKRTEPGTGMLILIIVWDGTEIIEIGVNIGP